MSQFRKSELPETRICRLNFLAARKTEKEFCPFAFSSRSLRFTEPEAELNDAILAFNSVTTNSERYSSLVNNAGLYMMKNLISNKNMNYMGIIRID